MSRCGGAHTFSPALGTCTGEAEVGRSQFKTNLTCKVSYRQARATKRNLALKKPKINTPMNKSLVLSNENKNVWLNLVEKWLPG